VSAASIDSPRPPRPGEELDAAALQRWLRLDEPVAIEQFPRGHSNLTYLLRAGPREIVLRRPPFGSKVKTAHDMGREYRVLSKLSAVWPRAPRPLFHCDDPSIIGAPFYGMERVRGVILRGSRPDADVSPPQARAIAEALIDTLAELHGVDFAAAGLGDLGRPEGYVERQVSGWARRYADSKTDDIPGVERIAQWLARNMPRESGAAIIHNDFKHDNVVLSADDLARVAGVLDWEMATVGDPLMDLGTALGYWVEEGDSDEMKMIAFGPTMLPGSPTRRELAQRYARRTGREVTVFHYCFALFKTAVVAQQIYARYKAGLTKDDRFAMMIAGVKILADAANEAASRGNF